MPTVYNAANEYAVAAFLKGSIGFLDIYDIIDKAMDKHMESVISEPSLSDILETEQWTYDYLRSITGEKN